MTGAAAAPTGTSTGQNHSGLGDLLLSRMTTPAGYIGTTPTGLIGRSGDLERLAAVTAAPDAGLVTVTGPAGVGKSRLVMEFFRHRGDGPGGGVEVFDFAQVTDTSVAGLMLRQLREQCYEGSPAVRKALERVAAGKHTLLFDHYEDVADDLAPLLAEFRRCCPQVRIVCVGTARLGLYGERVVRIGPLATGDPAVPAEPAALAGVPAVELFVQCARSVRPGFTLTAENAHDVLALCRHAGGLPLAIELAAAQITLAEPDLILERFESDPGDLHRLDHHPYSRHAGIGDMVAWVLARLRPEERTQLVHLAVFQGPFTLRAAVSVLGGLHGAVYRTMERLIDKSVLIPDERHDGEVRLSIPHALRRAAAGLLARQPGHAALRRAHAEHFRAAADAGATGSRPGPGAETRADLLAAFDHWREAGDGRAMAAVAHALRGQSATPAQAAQSLRLTEEALRAVPADDPGLYARTLEAAGDLALRLGAPAARGHLARAHAAHRGARDEQGAVRCLALLGEEAYAAGEPERARRFFENAYAAAGLTPQSAATRRHLTRRLAAVLRDAGDLPRAGELALTALTADLSGPPDTPAPPPPQPPAGARLTDVVPGGGVSRGAGLAGASSGDVAVGADLGAGPTGGGSPGAGSGAGGVASGADLDVGPTGGGSRGAGSGDVAVGADLVDGDPAGTGAPGIGLVDVASAPPGTAGARLTDGVPGGADSPGAGSAGVAPVGAGSAGAGPAVGGDPASGSGALLSRYVLATVRWREHDSAQARGLFADAAEQIGTLPESAPERAECLELLAITVCAWRRVTDWHLLTATLALADHLRRQSARPRPKPLRDLIGPILATAAQELTAAEYARAVRSGPGLTWQTCLRLIPADPPPPPAKATPTPTPPAAAEPDVPTEVATALTKRELEVALLVAEGMTNRIIARELGIAEWTVVNHLRKVMRKLGCQSRVQVTRRLSAS